MLRKLKSLTIGVMLITVSSLYGAGTASGTDVVNNATLSYSIGGETKEKTATSTFKVDDKVNLIVTTLDTQAVEAKSGANDQVLTYKVRNDGNTVHDFILTAKTVSSKAFAGTDNEVTDNYNLTDDVRIYVDSNGNGVYDADTDTQTYIDELAPDDEVTVFIVGNIPSDAADGNIAVYDLEVQVAEGGAAGTQGSAITSDDSNEVDQITTVQIVFADGAGSIDVIHDGKFSSADAFKVTTANVTIIKNSIVLSDPVNDTNNPKRIPGAVVRYCFIVENTGSSDATDAIVTDNLPSDYFDFSDSTVGLYKLTDNACDCNTLENVDGANGSNGQTPTNSDSTAKIDFGAIPANSKKCGYVTATIK